MVASTAVHILAGGVGGTSLDDIRLDTSTSKSQLFHHFPGGKAELVRAVADHQGEQVLDAQRLQRGVERMRDGGLLRPGVDPAALSVSMLATLEGGLLLAQVHQSGAPLETALDGILASLRAWAADGAPAAAT